MLVPFKPATSRLSATFSHAFIAPQRASQLHLCRVSESDGDKESPMQGVPTNTMTRSGRPEVAYPVQTQQPRISPVESRQTDQLIIFPGIVLRTYNLISWQDLLNLSAICPMPRVLPDCRTLTLITTPTKQACFTKYSTMTYLNVLLADTSFFVCGQERTSSA